MNGRQSSNGWIVAVGLSASLLVAEAVAQSTSGSGSAASGGGGSQTGTTGTPTTPKGPNPNPIGPGGGTPGYFPGKGGSGKMATDAKAAATPGGGIYGGSSTVAAAEKKGSTSSGTVSKTEAIRRVERAFDKYDTSKTGIVEKAQWEKILKEVGKE